MTTKGVDSEQPLQEAGGELEPGARDWAAAVRDMRDEILLLETLMDTIPDSIYFKDRESRFTRVNRYTAERFGLRDPADLIGKTDYDFFTLEHAEKAFRDEQEIIRSGRPVVAVEEKETLPDGGIRWVSTTKMPLRDSTGAVIGTFGISRDITDKKLVEEQLERQAFYDRLTELPNRSLFLNRLEHVFRRAQRLEGQRFLFAVIYLDLDRFKGVNDGLGHQAGDELLIQMARRLEACVRPSDTLARLGGDEFTILLEDIQSEADATGVADRIHKELSVPFKVADTEVFSTVSLGIAFSTFGYTHPDEMLRDADTAMYRAKANGRSRHEVFDAEMHRKAVTLLQLETDLRRVLERDECRVFYQPIVDLESRELLGFEALARWQHPERGLVMPEVFIPIAEDTGLIGPIGLWVLREACRQTVAWQKKFQRDTPLYISVNMSTRQLAQRDLAELVAGILSETGLPASSLRLEITENTLIQNLRASSVVVKQLHDMAVKVHIDDFGTGYSSLSYLQNFPVDTLKVDRSFVARMGGPEQSEIVRAIVNLAQSLGMSVTAEGVETAEQMRAVQQLNCTSAQGFFFSEPLPAADAERLLREGLPSF